MTPKYLVIFLGYAVVLVLQSVAAEDCSQDISNENCSLTTHNNEIEALSIQHTHEITTHMPELTTLTSSNMSADDSEGTTFNPTVIPLSSSVSNATETSTPNTVESSTLNLPETSNSIDNSTMNPTEASVLVETATSNSSTTNSTETSTLNSLENSTSSSTEAATSNAIETIISSSTEANAMETTTETETSTSYVIESSSVSEMNSSNSVQASSSNSSETSISISSDISSLNSSDTSTETSVTNSTEVTILSSTETSTSHFSEILISHASDTLPTNSSESSTMNSSETTTSEPTDITTMMPPNLMDTSHSPETTTGSMTINSSETSTSNAVETSTSHSTDDSTSNFIDSVTEVPTDNSADSSSDHLMETSTDVMTTENLTEISTENPTENALHDETTPFTTTNAIDEPKGRALNFSVEEESPNNVLTNMSNHHDEDSDLSDVTVHDDDHYNLDVDSLDAKILAPKNQIHNFSLSVCEKGGLTYENGEKLELGCESVCTCRDGKMDCTDRCSAPYFRRGKKIDDPLCSAKEADDPCCALLICAGDTEPEPLEYCSYENKIYNRGDTFNKSCTEICTCEIAGKISCKPRCPPVTKTSDRCVEVPDPNDYCCLKVLCDVTLDEHDTEKEEEKGKPKLLSARYVNATAILLTFDMHTKLDDNENLPIIEVSNDTNSWHYYKLLPGNVVFVKDRIKYLRIENMSETVEVEDGELASHSDMEHDSHTESDLTLQLHNEHDTESSMVSEDHSVHCLYKNRMFEDGEEYNDNCTSLCKCQNGEMKCLSMQCPTYFGVDVLDPNCIEWETIPPNFIPSPPNCCPEKVHCVNNGSCEYEGQMYKNWDLIPSSVTGCEKKCYCEMGNVECQNSCPPVTALPPPTLNCPPHLAMVGHMPDDDCCKYWICNTDTHPSETLQSQTESDIKGQIYQTSTDKYMGPFVPKNPSKVLGPLAVYVNEDNDQPVTNNSLGVPHKPIINPVENPFYHVKPSPQSPKHSISKPVSSKDKLNDHSNPSYLGPFNYNNGKISKPSKDIRNKITNKDHSLFVTPPTHLSEENIYQKHEHFVPNYYTPPPPELTFDHGHNPTHINIHSHSTPEEIFQFIHQHPELSNYPSGSVLEIHNAVPSNNVNQIFGNEGVQSVQRPKIHLVPYVVPQTADGQPIYDNLPPGLSLEEILGEFQKNSQGFQTNPLDFLPPPQKSANTGPVSNPPQNGLLTHTNNATNSENDGQMLPESYPGQHPQDEIIIQSLEAVDPHKVRLSFTVPHIIVGLHGRFEVRYTHNKDEKDLDSWMLTVFAPPNDLIATPSLEFDLTDLNADTEYSIKITVTLRDLHNMPTSKIYKVKTPKEVHPPVIPINPDLAITDINATWVTVVWRAFTQYELQFIDGIQLRYKEIDGRIFTATPLIHRAVTKYTLEKLKPNTKYEIGIYFIPFPGQMTELRAENILHFTTANAIDTYGFNVTLEISQIKSQSVEISWNGVPYPEDKYVNIYRAIYQSDSGKEDQSTFKIAKRDSPTKTIIRDLKPGTRYRIWLEVYLTNGKIKTSNVEDFVTKPRAAPALGSSTQQDKLSRAEVLESKGDYYGPLVIVAILAAIAILSTLILLLILVRRHNQNKAAITPPSTRISQSAYDNPTYKVEIQQETMGL